MFCIEEEKTVLNSNNSDLHCIIVETCNTHGVAHGTHLSIPQDYVFQTEQESNGASRRTQRYLLSPIGVLWKFLRPQQESHSLCLRQFQVRLVFCPAEVCLFVQSQQHGFSLHIN